MKVEEGTAASSVKLSPSSFIPQKNFLLFLAFILLPSTFIFLPSSFCESPAPRAASAVPSFETYRMIRTRNVFDPDRRPLSTPAPSSAPAAAPIRQSDYVALTGTMINAGKALAFFSGSRADFNKVLGVRDSIASATITNITAAGVEVDRGGRKITVAVGQTLPLDNSAPAAAPAPQPVVAAAAAAVTGAAGSASTVAQPSSTGTQPAAAAAGAAPSPAAGELNAKQQEIMKRMMEKRKQDGLQ